MDYRGLAERLQGTLQLVVKERDDANAEIEQLLSLLRALWNANVERSPNASDRMPQIFDLFTDDDPLTLDVGQALSATPQPDSRDGKPHRPHQGVVAPYRCNHPDCPVYATPQPDSDYFAWLIEAGDGWHPTYEPDDRIGGQERWTEDAFAAHHYSTRAEAEAQIKHRGYSAKAVEHGFIAPQPDSDPRNAPIPEGTPVDEWARIRGFTPQPDSDSLDMK